MRTLALLAAFAVSGCTVARVAGDTAVTAVQVTAGAADLLF